MLLLVISCMSKCDEVMKGPIRYTMHEPFLNPVSNILLNLMPSHHARNRWSTSGSRRERHVTKDKLWRPTSLVLRTERVASGIYHSVKLEDPCSAFLSISKAFTSRID